MHRSTESIGARLSCLSRREQCRFLYSLAHALTITARGLYENDATKDERISAFITINELQHQICGKLLDLSGAERVSYTNDDFFENLFAVAGDTLRAALEWNIERGFKAAARRDTNG